MHVNQIIQCINPEFSIPNLKKDARYIIQSVSPIGYLWILHEDNNPKDRVLGPYIPERFQKV